MFRCKICIIKSLDTPELFQVTPIKIYFCNITFTKDFEIWKRKFKDYLVLTGLNDAPRETQVATLRGFLSSDMYDKLRISVGVEDDTDLGVE